MAKRKVIFSFDAMCEWETALVINNLFSKERNTNDKWKM
jgi:hypothetical protein